MDKTAKGYAIIGTVLVCLPILITCLIMLRGLGAGYGLSFNFLSLIQYYPLILAGGGALVWAAKRAHLRREIIGWGFGVAVLVLIIGFGIAILGGANIDSSGWGYLAVYVAMGVFALATIVMAIGGVMLVRDLSKHPDPAP